MPLALANPRATTLLVAFSTLISNVASSILLDRLPDDPYHLAGYGGWYLHFAGVLSVFGVVGALRQHGPSIALFANYLLIDTLLCALPRFLLPLLLQPSTLCSPAFFLPAIQNPYVKAQHSIASSSSSSSTAFSASTASTSRGSISGDNNGSSWAAIWSSSGMDCETMLRLAQITLVAGALVATALQFVGAMCVRQYARVLWLRELREEEAGCGIDIIVTEVPSQQECRGLGAIYEEKA